LVAANVNGNLPINFLGVVHAESEEIAVALLEDAKAKFNPDELMLASLSPVLGTHTGPGTIGVAYVAGLDPELFKA